MLSSLSPFPKAISLNLVSSLSSARSTPSLFARFHCARRRECWKCLDLCCLFGIKSTVNLKISRLPMMFKARVYWSSLKLMESTLPFLLCLRSVIHHLLLSLLTTKHEHLHLDG
ncbi:hypothetical protein CRYUN_Cryun23aG0068600 [Craigia yunnanensis]